MNDEKEVRKLENAVINYLDSEILTERAGSDDRRRVSTKSNMTVSVGGAGGAQTSRNA